MYKAVSVNITKKNDEFNNSMQEMKNFYLKYKYNIFYCIIITLLLLLFVPYQETFYLKKDIEKFQNIYYWKMILIFLILILIFLTRFIFKEKERKITDFIFPILNATLFVIFLAFIFQNIIISIVLFSNRIIDRNQTQNIYKVKYYKELNMSEITSEMKTDTINNIYEKKFIYKLEDIRLKKNLKSINKSDTIHIKYGNGLFGIKYLKE